VGSFILKHASKEYWQFRQFKIVEKNEALNKTKDFAVCQIPSRDISPIDGILFFVCLCIAFPISR
jgi:hypothetical protein